MKIDGDKRTRVGDSTQAATGSRINYPYDTDWGLVDRPPAAPLKRSVYPRLAKLAEGAIVINLGSGDGNFERHAPHPDNRPYRFISIDQNPDAIDKLRRQTISGGPDQALVGDITALDLDLGDKQASAVVISRVLHALDADDQVAVVQGAAKLVEPGALIHITALADTDWKAREAARRGIVAADRLVDFYDIMRLHEIDRTEPWKAFSFTPHRFSALAEASGLEVVGKIVEFTEPTSFPHLEGDQPEVTYYYAALRKPGENGKVRRRGRGVTAGLTDKSGDTAQEARTIIDQATGVK